MKPFGKCGSCKYRNRCEVETQTNAKVIECVYQDFFKKTDATYLEKRKSKNRPSKV
jgi:hypothetical protein